MIALLFAVAASGAAERARDVLPHQRHGSVQDREEPHVQSARVQGRTVRAAQGGSTRLTVAPIPSETADNCFVQVGYRLAEFRELVKEVVRSACRTALLEVGFTPDDYFYDGMDSPGLYQGASRVFLEICLQ